MQPSDGEMPPMRPGQFVQVLVPAAKDTLLRLPISINNVEDGQLWLMVQMIGEGTKALGSLPIGGALNLVLPLGNGFSVSEAKGRVLLVGGGVGIAPLLYTGRALRENGAEPIFLLGARTADGVLERELFEQIGRVLITTEDGSAGERGFVTQHSALQTERFDKIMVCGPKPMMVAVARYARQKDIDCEVSLENMMACGLGACLCCVEKTVKGNVCVCTEGPVFNINQLTWQL
ncbi:MAG: dihydroorotate dehydrogenase electron transfer subunit [Bacteroidaceae bacterium]|nr:dihydroorotate dehydrogenase electron transfer subunit [Bacteroidaceae bacterium]